jgi:hypothetical protein
MQTITGLSALIILFMTLTVPFGSRAAEQAGASAVSQDIENLLRTENLSIRGAEIITQAMLLEVYQDHEFAPYWGDHQRVRELMELISDSADQGSL